VTLLVLVKREVKAFLKNPAFIIGVVLLFSIYGSMGALAGRAAQEAAGALTGARIAVVAEESTPLVNSLLYSLNKTLNGRLYACTSVEDATRNYNVVLVILEGFTVNATSQNRDVFVKVWTRAPSLSTITGQAYTAVVSSIKAELEKLLPVAISATYNVTVDPSKRVGFKTTVSVYGRELSESAFQALSSLSSTLPLFISLFIGINAAYAAQMVAMEKEEKAFEMLLAQPVKRRDIVLAKIIGASIASLIFVLVYFAGFTAMFAGLATAAQQAPGTAPSISSPSTPGELEGVFNYSFLAAIGVSVLLGFILSGALGVIVGSLVSDVRIASALTAPVLLLFIGVGFAAMFIGFSPSPVSATVAGLTVVALPYMHVLASISGETQLVLFSYAASLAITVAVLVLAVKLFERDIIVLGIKLPFKKRVEK